MIFVSKVFKVVFSVTMVFMWVFTFVEAIDAASHGKTYFQQPVFYLFCCKLELGGFTSEELHFPVLGCGFSHCCRDVFVDTHFVNLKIHSLLAP